MASCEFKPGDHVELNAYDEKIDDGETWAWVKYVVIRVDELQPSDGWSSMDQVKPCPTCGHLTPDGFRITLRDLETGRFHTVRTDNFPALRKAANG